MNILVAGGAGYLGSVLVPKLLSEGHSVTVIDILMFGGESLLSFSGQKNFRLVAEDIRSPAIQDVLKKGKFDAVVHLAALVGEPACKIKPAVTRKINYEATRLLVKEAKKSGVKRFIFTSTCSNYGISDVNELADESSPLNPLSLYAETKIAAEKAVLEENDEFFHTTALRLATLFGLSPKMRFNLLINEMVREAWFGKDIKLYKELAWRPYAHVSDAADAICRVLTAKVNLISKEIFNIGSENVQKKTLISLVKSYQPNLKIVSEGGQPDNRDYCVSFRKISKVLNFHPKFKIKDGIEEMFYALEKHLIADCYADKYNAWLNLDILKKYKYE